MSSIQNQNGNLIGTLKPQGVLKAAISKPLIVSDDETVYILRDEYGNEAVGVLVDVETVLDATPNDIRKGVTAVTEEGITVGEKVIPIYFTTYGYNLIPSGEVIRISFVSDDMQLADFTHLQALVCLFDGSVSKSVATEMVVISDSVYNVRSNEKLATVVKDVENDRIDLTIINTSESMLLVRYFTCKEVL